MVPIYEINSQFAHYVLLDKHMLQQIGSGQIKIIITQKTK